MKFFSSCILALSVLQGTSAFLVQSPKAIKSVALFETSAFSNQGTSTGAKAPAPAVGGALQPAKQVLATLPTITVQGDSLETWSFADPAVESVKVFMKTEGRPLNTNIELWHGPDNTPQKMAVYIEDGNERPLSAVIATPRGHNAVAIYNTASLEFPFQCAVEADSNDITAVTKTLAGVKSVIVQGGAIRTYPFDPMVESVQVLLETDGRPLNARIELLQGPNNKKQFIEIYSEDGMDRPFFMVIETPGAGNVVRVVNTATIEYPLNARVEPYRTL